MHEIWRGGEVRQLPDQAAEHLYGECRRGGETHNGVNETQPSSPGPTNPNLNLCLIIGFLVYML